MTLTSSSSSVVYRISRFLFDVRKSNSKPSPFVIFLNDLANPNIYSKGRYPLMSPLLASV